MKLAMKMVNRIYNRAPDLQIDRVELLEEPGPLTWRHLKPTLRYRDLMVWKGKLNNPPLLEQQVVVLILQTCRGFIEHLGLEEDWTW